MKRTHQNIIWFDICVHNVGFSQQTQCQEQLMGVCTNSPNIQTDILSEALYNITEIHTGFKVREEHESEKSKYLIDSKTIHRCPRCSNVRSRRTICFLSSGSACFSLLRIWTSFNPARYLLKWRVSRDKNRNTNSYIDSWHLMILMATSRPTSPTSPCKTRARTTFANIPLPREEKTW